MITFGSSCTGIGSPEVAWHEGLGWQSKFTCEIERFPSQVLKRHWPETPNLGDMTKVDWRSLECDVFVSGTPCQSFSFAGLRQGLNDARGNLTLTYVEAVHAIRHLRYAAWENVPGVLSDKTNAFGCLLAGLIGTDAPLLPPDRQWGAIPYFDAERYDVHRTFGWQHIRWTSRGMASGPLGRTAWRIFDAQYFGLAQRRERVLLVFCPVAGGGDPSAVLFEPKGLSGNPPAREEPGQRIAGTISARTEGGGGLGTDFELAGGLQPVNQTASDSLSPSLRAQAQHSHRTDSAAIVGVERLAFGGGNRSGPIDVTATLTAKGNRQDFEVETFISEIQPIAHTLRGEGFDASEDGTGRGTPLVPVAFDCKASGQNGFGVGETHGPLRAMGHNGSHQNGGDHAAVAYSVALRGREGGGTAELGDDVAGTLRASQGGGDKPHVLTRMAVRRLTPIECARLQGFPDHHTEINGDATPDGPQYKAYGNSMATKMMLWLGRQIEKDIKRLEPK